MQGVAIQKRNQTIEALRIVAAFSIVWYHGKAPGMELAYSGLSFFILLSVSLTIRNGAVRQGRLLPQLILPWLIWYVIYAGINLLTGRPVIPTDNSLLSGLLASSSIHLWYLPFMWLVLTLCGPIATAAGQRGSRRPLFIFATAAAAISILTIPLWEPPSVAAGYPWAQYAQAITPVLLGVVLGLARSGAERGALLALIATLIGSALLLPQRGVALPHAVALIALMLAMNHPLHWFERRNLQWISSCMLGVYLIHPIFIGVAKRLIPEPLPLQIIFAFACCDPR